jgi:hypothetical protein
MNLYTYFDDEHAILVIDDDGVEGACWHLAGRSKN